MILFAVNSISHQSFGTTKLLLQNEIYDKNNSYIFTNLFFNAYLTNIIIFIENSSRNRVETGAAEGMAAQKTLYCEICPFDWSVFTKSNQRIF